LKDNCRSQKVIIFDTCRTVHDGCGKRYSLLYRKYQKSIRY
jgi:hypothetical protein